MANAPLKFSSRCITTDIDVLGGSAHIHAFDGGVAVRTPDRPDYYWGNFLIMDQAPIAADMDRWNAAFERELPGLPHRTFTWNTTDAPSELPWDTEAAGWEYSTERVLVGIPDDIAESARTIPDGCCVEELHPDDEAAWRSVVDLAVITRPGRFSDEAFFSHAAAMYAARRRDVRTGTSLSLAVRDDVGRVIASLGIVSCSNGLARYQSVMTHPEYRRHGCASVLLARAAVIARDQYGSSELVIVCEADGIAERVYTSAGFVAHETVPSLERTPEAHLA